MPLNWPLAFYVSCDDSLFIKLAISTFISQFKCPRYTHTHTYTNSHEGAWLRLARHVRNEYMNSVDRRRRRSSSRSSSRDRDLCAHALSVVRISQYGVICSTASTAPPIDVNLWHWHAPLARPSQA